MQNLKTVDFLSLFAIVIEKELRVFEKSLHIPPAPIHTVNRPKKSSKRRRTDKRTNEEKIRQPNRKYKICIYFQNEDLFLTLRDACLICCTGRVISATPPNFESRKEGLLVNMPNAMQCDHMTTNCMNCECASLQM